MDFDLPETALAVRDGVAAVAAKYDNAYWSRCEEEHRFPDEVFDDLGEAAGSACASPRSTAAAGRACSSWRSPTSRCAPPAARPGSFIYVTTPGFGAMTLARHGTEEQKQRILPGLAAGEVQFCFALTEPDAGSQRASRSPPRPAVTGATS